MTPICKPTANNHLTPELPRTGRAGTVTTPCSPVPVAAIPVQCGGVVCSEPRSPRQRARRSSIASRRGEEGKGPFTRHLCVSGHPRPWLVTLPSPVKLCTAERVRWPSHGLRELLSASRDAPGSPQTGPDVLTRHLTRKGKGVADKWPGRACRGGRPRSEKS